ncbi:uncharacterized protein Dvir_GJ22188 [Drosophila virilis]|uniref:Uncharacterized protein n=1 Tax=Drosophila virilis TaxID=7244 RepID=B4LK99_DROVI|nr:uncharacterized protein Dvir_GJ22188 [Drosophila virilis]
MGSKTSKTVKSIKNEKSDDDKYKDTHIIFRFVYWAIVFIVLGMLVTGLYYTLKSDFGQCSSHDVRCY